MSFLSLVQQRAERGRTGKRKILRLSILMVCPCPWTLAGTRAEAMPEDLLA